MVISYIVIKIKVPNCVILPLKVKFKNLLFCRSQTKNMVHLGINNDFKELPTYGDIYNATWSLN